MRPCLKTKPTAGFLGGHLPEIPVLGGLKRGNGRESKDRETSTELNNVLHKIRTAFIGGRLHFAVVGTELRAFCMLGKCSTTGLSVSQLPGQLHLIENYSVGLEMYLV